MNFIDNKCLGEKLIPPLDHRGLLPGGVHSGTWNDIETAFGTDPRRKVLLTSAKAFSSGTLHPLHPAPLFLAGSTFSDKPDPSDIEATIKVDPTGLDPTQVMLLFRLQIEQRKIKADTEVDFYVTIDMPGYNDFTEFFQYVGEKTAAVKHLSAKDKRGVVEVKTWLTP